MIIGQSGHVSSNVGYSIFEHLDRSNKLPQINIREPVVDDHNDVADGKHEDCQLKRLQLLQVLMRGDVGRQWLVIVEHLKQY